MEKETWEGTARKTEGNPLSVKFGIQGQRRTQVGEEWLTVFSDAERSSWARNMAILNWLPWVLASAAHILKLEWVGYLGSHWWLSLVSLAWFMLVNQRCGHDWNGWTWEGNGNPLQYSCLENRLDRGAWPATGHRVAKSPTQLKRMSRQQNGLKHDQESKEIETAYIETWKKFSYKRSKEIQG